MPVITPKAQRRYGTLGFLLLAAGLFVLYRWAEPSSSFLNTNSPAPVPTVTMRLEHAPFESYTNGHKSWSVWAERIDLERTAGAAMSMIQSATIEGIRDGVLYRIPDIAAPIAAASGHNKDNRSASFCADRGRYSIQNLDQMPADWAQNYTLQWQFRLMGSVRLQTLAGEKLMADSMTLFELTNRHSGKSEHRIVWDSGAQMISKKVRIHSNEMRMDISDKVLECTNGVRCTYPEGAIQTDRAFFSMKESLLRCPDQSSGTEKKITYAADGLVMDVKRQLLSANHVQLKFPVEQGKN